MIDKYIKYFFITLCSFYIYHKLLNRPYSKKEHVFIAIYCIVANLPVFFIHNDTTTIFIPFMVILFYIFILCITNCNYKVAFVTTILSFGFSFFIFSLCAVCLMPTYFTVINRHEFHDIFYIIEHSIIGLLQLLIVSFIFRVSRLKKGMPFILQKSLNAYGVVVGIIILICIALLSTGKLDKPAFFLFLFCVAICGLLLVIWWRRRLTRIYLERIRAKEMDELKKEIEKLKEENEELSKIIHKDNKLIPAMEMAVQNLLSCTAKDISKEELADMGSELLKKLNELSCQRKGILSDYEITTALLPKTGLLRIDSLLCYMQKKAASSDTAFLVAVNCDVKYMVNNVIDEDSLATLVADLVENAIIAAKSSQTKKVLLAFNIEDMHYCLEIFDSGSPFDDMVLKNIGKVRYTTHAATGGSGIGLMTTMEIVNHFNASFYIDENISNTDYTKKVGVRFDLINQFTVLRQQSNP